MKPVYGFGPFRLDVADRKLFRGQEAVPLTPKACEILLVLVERALGQPGSVVEKDDLMRAVWRDTFVEDGNLTFNISMLRKALAPFECIETVPRRGYRFTVPVGDVSSIPAAVARTPGSDLAVHRKARVKLWTGAVLAALALAGALVTARLVSHSNQPKSLAILPFQSLNPDQREPVLELGLADVLITRLGSLPGVIVRPTTTVRRFTGANADPVQAGRALGVEAVLSGFVQRAGDRVRLTAQMIDTKTGRHLWDGQFDQRSTDLLGLEDDLSGRIAAALAVHFTAVRRDTTPEVHDLYLRGRVAFHNWSESSAKQALAYFEHATEADPNYGPAFAGIAASLMQQVRWGVLAPRDAMPRASTAARRALALDDSLAEAHLALGMIEMSYDWDLDSAAREFQRAISLNPNLAEAYGAFGAVLTYQRKPDDAVRQRRIAQGIDPLVPVGPLSIGWDHYFARQYDEALAQYRKAAEMDAAFPAVWWSFGETYEAQGKYREAIDAYRKSVELSGRSTRALAGLGHALGAAGNRQEAAALLDELALAARSRYVSPMFRAMIYAGAHDNDHAFAMLEEALRDRSDWMVQLPVWPLFDSLRDDPRFAALVARIKPGAV